jgi:3-hydroxyisobutyrate dehydrogenase
MNIGFIGLGNVGAKLAGSLLRNGFALTVRDLDPEQAQPLLDQGATWAASARELAAEADVVITCLPSPKISAAVMEDPDGVLAGLRPESIWLEMSTTDEAEVKRLGAAVRAQGALPMDCPVSGGCHRAATGNIAIFAGGERSAFERALPALTAMGRRILHTGELGSASILKVVTNYLASVHLVSLGEALTVARQSGMDMATTYEAIRISSGNSFVHETESQVILNGSRDINFTMDLVAKDVGVFDALSRKLGIPLELSPLLVEVFEDGRVRYGDREFSPNIIRRLEEATGQDVRAPGFPAEIVDTNRRSPATRCFPRDEHDS